MGKYIIEIRDDAKEDIRKIYKSGKKSDIKKIEMIFSELSENPRLGIGHPERLRHYKEEIWSRKINKKDRITYEIIDSQVIVVVLSALGHYSDK